MELKEAMQKALAFEKKGHGIYMEAAKATANPVVNKTFTYLAEQELRHVEAIEDYLKTGDLHAEALGDDEERTAEFFTMTTEEFKERTALSADDVKAHETALHLEKESYDFYAEALADAEGQATKDFLVFLMEQENAHYKLISRAYEYVSDPVSFHAQHEGWLFEG
ncbi:ferritin family protein [Candidatus Woesearchaeota archaeon]|nr:ferritin family protein [Candidatus Woesearchaeota archaeon]